jgi:trigger factor
MKGLSPMNVSVETLNSFTKKLSFELPVELVDAEYDKVFKSVRSTAKLPGFRKGKVPTHVIEQQYAEMIKDEVLKNLVNNTCFEALQEHRIIPVSPPAIESDTVTKGEPFTYSVKVETYPEIDVTQYQGLSLKKELQVPNEVAVQERLAQLQERMSQIKPLDQSRPVASGDFVVMDFTGYQDGVAFPGGSATDHQLQVGSGSFIPGFEEQMIGLNAGETKRITVTFPEGYGNASLSGKDAEFEITIKEIKVKEVPPLDDDLAQSAGGFDTFEQLKDEITATVQEEERARIDGELKDRLQELLVELNPCEIPEVMAQRQLSFMLESMKQRLASQQMTLEMVGITPEDFNERYRESAEQHVKEMLILHAIAKKEGFSLTQEDLDAKYPQIAEEVGRDLAEIKGYYEGNRDAAEHLGAQIVEDKVLAFLLAGATITEVPKEELAK